MYEIGELIKDENYKERIITIVKRNARIFEVGGRNKYIIYWQDRYKSLEKETKLLDELNRKDSIEELIKLERIQRALPDLLKYVADESTIICDDKLSQIDFEN